MSDPDPSTPVPFDEGLRFISHRLWIQELRALCSRRQIPWASRWEVNMAPLVVINSRVLINASPQARQTQHPPHRSTAIKGNGLEPDRRIPGVLRATKLDGEWVSVFLTFWWFVKLSSDSNWSVVWFHVTVSRFNLEYFRWVFVSLSTTRTCKRSTVDCVTVVGTSGYRRENPTHSAHCLGLMLFEYWRKRDMRVITSSCWFLFHQSDIGWNCTGMILYDNTGCCGDSENFGGLRHRLGMKPSSTLRGKRWSCLVSSYLMYTERLAYHIMCVCLCVFVNCLSIRSHSIWITSDSTLYLWLPINVKDFESFLSLEFFL